MLFRIGVILGSDDLQPIAERGSEFIARGLRRHFGKLSVMQQLNILARLEAAKAEFSLDDWFAKPRHKINRGAFVVSDAQLSELGSLLERAPKLRTLAHNLLAL
jgi:hypothetical protein